MLWQASADGHHICRILGVSCLRGQAVLVTKLYRQRLANEMTSKSGQPHYMKRHQTACMLHILSPAYRWHVLNNMNWAHILVCQNQRHDLRKPASQFD